MVGLLLLPGARAERRTLSPGPARRQRPLPHRAASLPRAPAPCLPVLLQYIMAPAPREPSRQPTGL